ncbi:MAG: hypothetical protein IJ720_01270, partial [Clostridia bacterium]|nr:hypothetical protein [Clostridia bacterium]
MLGLITSDVAIAKASDNEQYRHLKEAMLIIEAQGIMDSPDTDPELVGNLETIAEYVDNNPEGSITGVNQELAVEMNDNNNSSILKVSAKGKDYANYPPISNADLNAKEKALFNSNPAYGTLVLSQGKYAMDSERGCFGSNTWATNGDAYRHALWNALGAYMTSQSFMQQFADAHEKGASNYDVNNIDFKMDIRNNNSGRSLLNSMTFPKKPANGMTISKIISDNIATATKEGKLVRFVIKGVEQSTLKP